MTFTTLAVWGTVFIVLFAMETQVFRIQALGIAELQERHNCSCNLALFLLLFLIAGLRSPGTGADTGGYYGAYRQIVNSDLPLSYYWSNMIDAFRQGQMFDTYFWSFFERVLAIVIKSPQLWMAAISGSFLLSVYVTVRRYSKDAVFSWAYIRFVQL